MACRAHLGEVLEKREELQRYGGRVLAVSLTRPDQVTTYLQRHPLDVDLVCDPSLEAYRLFGLGRTSFWTFLKPRIILRYLKAIRRGTRPEKVVKGDDLLQLGGDFVLDRQRRLIYAFRSRDATDRPSADDLLAAVRQGRR